MNRPDIDAIEEKHLIPVVMGQVLPEDHIAVALAHCINWIRHLEEASFAKAMAVLTPPQEGSRTDLTYWFPKIVAAGLPVPRTVTLSMSDETIAEVWRMIDHAKPVPGGPWESFVAAAQAAGDAAIGYPLFLRSGLFSGKHDWDRCCNVRTRARLGEHMFNIIYMAECVGVVGGWRHWALREFLPTKPIGVCPGYMNMPICREFRFFVDDGVLRCWHPYWPEHSLVAGQAEFFPGNSSYDAFAHLMPHELAKLTEMACTAGRTLGGSWSVDLLDTKRGWVVTDMAEAARSWHWEGCPHAA